MPRNVLASSYIFVASFICWRIFIVNLQHSKSFLTYLKFTHLLSHKCMQWGPWHRAKCSSSIWQKLIKYRNWKVNVISECHADEMLYKLITFYCPLNWKRKRKTFFKYVHNKHADRNTKIYHIYSVLTSWAISKFWASII